MQFSTYFRTFGILTSQMSCASNYEQLLKICHLSGDLFRTIAVCHSDAHQYNLWQIQDGLYLFLLPKEV